MSAVRRLIVLALGALSLCAAQAQFLPSFNFPPRNVGTIANAQQAKAPYVLAKGGVPLVGVSTGTMANNGVMTVGTALPLAYSNAFFYMPAGSVAAGVPAAASWLFGQCSTTTACTLFNNTYTSGVPTAPVSPTAFSTTGPGAFTGDTAEEFAVTITVPANAMGANGAVRVSYQAAANATAGTKNVSIRFSGNAGTVLYLQNLGASSVAAAGSVVLVANAGATNSQLSSTLALWGVNASTSSVKGSADTTASTTVVISLGRSVATDNLVLQPPIIELISDGT